MAQRPSPMLAARLPAQLTARLTACLAAWILAAEAAAPAGPAALALAGPRATAASGSSTGPGDPGAEAAVDEEEAASEPARGPAPGVLGHLERWTQRFEREKGAGDRDAELREILRDAAAAAAGAWRRESVAAVLDLHGAALRRMPPPEALPEELEEHPDGVRRTARLTGEWLAEVLDRELERWLAREVVAAPRLHPAERRLAALALLGASRASEHVLPLVVTARTAEPEIGLAALRALVGWPEEAVHGFFVDRLEASWPSALAAADSAAAVAGAQAERHFRTCGELEPGRAAVRLKRHAQRALGSGDWRAAARAVAVVGALPDAVAVPVCLEAMELWVRRGKEGHRSVRIVWDLARELERRSGRAIGPRPDRWRSWWDAVCAGTIEAARPAGGGVAGYSKAGFFGLRPETDRVTFVLDRSGSMRTLFGVAERTSAGVDPRHSRFEEAVEQMEAFLRAAGAAARFNVVLFDDGSDAWRRVLVPATEANLRSARSWMLARRPDGGTQLRHGVERAMELEPGGRSVDLERLEADTIIVLCDGETAEGPRWVRPLLARTNPAARLVFHCVGVGGRGDGTLEALATETGGRFVRVD